MRMLLFVSAVIEAVMGILLLLLPSFTVSILLGVPIDTPQGNVASRIAGAALLAVAVACWSSKNSRDREPVEGTVTALLIYNLASLAILVYAGVGLELHGPLLWPAIVLHTALSGWCVASLWFRQRRAVDSNNT